MFMVCYYTEGKITSTIGVSHIMHMAINVIIALQANLHWEQASLFAVMTSKKARRDSYQSVIPSFALVNPGG